MNGKIYLVPVTLGGDDYSKVIPEKVVDITRHLRFFVVEDIRSARRYLRMIDKQFPIDETVFFELNEHTGESDISQYLEPALNGSDIGVMSEAGLPGIADPGARIIELAHKRNLVVTPLTGPSSIILALISSGLNGQNFTFNGYLPVKPAERSSRLRELEKKAEGGYAQIFIEAPYRAQKMVESIISTCHDNTMLCVASEITLQSESIKTMKISEWKKNIPSLNDKRVIFILQ
ncbi:MAG TPA: SAM-dependent methyltransferase [Bacteroidales bacterium]|nr:SAM-dependent methyltransferase [Bacteroidales bacterium]HPT21010.1 SAM-dependent methyltransferase [Bacteroidales bacterium]